MYAHLLLVHSLLRWFVLLALLVVLFRSLLGYLGKRNYAAFDNQAGILLLTLVHAQLLIGVALYFVSPLVQTALSDMPAAMKDETLRFAAVEHVTIMLLAVVAITAGRIWSKKATLDDMKHRRALICYSIGFILIIAGIPWEKAFQ